MREIIQKYIVGNAIDVSSLTRKHKLPDFNLVISSPPYFDLINYENNKDQIGYGSRDYSDYLETIANVYQQCYDLSSDNATFWLIVDTFKKKGETKLFPFDIVNKLKETGIKTWVLKDIIVWDKGKNLPWNQKGNFKNQHEYILFFSKNENYIFNVDKVREILDLKKWWKTYPERYNPDGKAPSNVWHINTPMQGWGENKQEHFCPFPFALVERIINLCSNEGDFVFDPFAGSGAVLAMAKLMDRNSAGIDINKDYKTRFKNQVIDGAKKYWTKRVIQIEEMTSLMQDFKETNKKLRKLKVVHGICEYINKKNNHQFLIYAKDKPNNGLDILIYKNGVSPDVAIEDNTLKDLIHQAKIQPNIQILDQSKIVSSIGSDKVFKYKLGKFYSYSSTCDTKTINKALTKYDYVYSTISLKISNE